MSEDDSPMGLKNDAAEFADRTASFFASRIPNVTNGDKSMKENSTPKGNSEPALTQFQRDLRSGIIPLAGVETLLGIVEDFATDQKRVLANFREALGAAGFTGGYPHAGIAAELNQALTGTDEIVLRVHEAVREIKIAMLAPAVAAAELARQRSAG